MKEHDGNCTIYASLRNAGMPEAGICTCGYGLYTRFRTGSFEDMYSDELRQKLETDNGDNSELINEILGIEE